MLIYLIRHGESSYNVEHRLQGQSDEPVLSPRGRRHAQSVATAMAALPIEAVFSSPLRRALETARPVAEALKLPLITDDRLKEINIGVFQGLLASEIGERYPRETALWRSQDPDFQIPGGESRRELMRRSEAALRAVHDVECQQVAVVAHGGVLAAGLKALLGVPAERNPFMLYNGSISQLEWAGQVKLVTLNQTDHLRLADCELATRTGDLA
ncbi:MAG TPA: histidine phosphatase family protein [Pirellulales bacterium]|nr:histidine phosphatase family protein [Pirellulales bacterium]